MDDSPLYSLFLFIIFIIINGLMYAFGEAIRSVNETDIEKRGEEGDKKSIKIKKIIESPDKFVTTVHIVTWTTVTIVGYFHLKNYVAICKEWLTNLMGSVVTDGFIYFIAYIIIALYLMLLIISLGVLVPKRLGRKYCNGCARMLVGFVSFVTAVLTPFSWLVNFFSGIVLKIFGIDSGEELLNVTEEEIISMVNEGHEQGILKEREAEMISNIIELDDKTADDIMVHRKNVIAVDGSWTLEEAVEFIINQNYSRFPVYIGSKDNIIGILHLRNAMARYCKKTDNNRQIKDINDILMEAKFIPESRNLADLFRDMQLSKIHMQIVVDEYGQTSGIVAMEDILEEIVGNIFDEYDVEENNITDEGNGSYLIKGMTTLEEMEEVLGGEFEDEDYDTLNGYLISKLDRIPADDENPELIIDNYSYNILAVRNNTISLVRVKRLSCEESMENENREDKD